MLIDFSCVKVTFLYQVYFLLPLCLTSQACGSGQSLSVWNLPACECVSGITTSAATQDVSFDDNQVSSLTCIKFQVVLMLPVSFKGNYNYPSLNPLF